MPRPRFSLAALLLLVLLAAAYLGGFVHARLLYQQNVLLLHLATETQRQSSLIGLLQDRLAKAEAELRARDELQSTQTSVNEESTPTGEEN